MKCIFEAELEIRVRAANEWNLFNTRRKTSYLQAAVQSLCSISQLYQCQWNNKLLTFAAKGALYYVTIITALFSHINNYSPKWRWIVVDIYRAAKRRGKYPPLSPTLRWIIVLVYTTQAEYLAPKKQLYLWKCTDKSRFVFLRLLGGE